MAHGSARLTVAGRLLLIERVVVDGWSVAQAAGAKRCSVSQSSSCAMSLIGLR